MTSPFVLPGSHSPPGPPPLSSHTRRHIRDKLHIAMPIILILEGLLMIAGTLDGDSAPFPCMHREPAPSIPTHRVDLQVPGLHVLGLARIPQSSVYLQFLPPSTEATLGRETMPSTFPGE